MSNFTMSDFVTVIFVLGTFVFFFIWLFKDFLKIAQSLNQAAHQLPQEGAVELGTLLSSLGATPLDLHLKKYLRTLFQDAQSRWHTYSEAQSYFTLSLLLGAENQRRWQNYANIMLGLGILGTFVGLTLGLWNFDLENTDKIKESIQTLVPGMKTAFLTSVAGMTTSLLANFLPKFLLKDAHQKLERFCQVLDESFLIHSDRELELFYSYQNDTGQRVFPAEFMRDILRDSNEQTRGIKRFTEDLAEGIILSSETMDLLADKIASALDRPMTQHMLPALQDLQKAVEELRNEKQESIQEFISGVTGQFTESMEGIADKFESALTQSTRDKLAGLAEAVATAGASFSSLPSLMEAQIAQVQETMTGLSDRLGEDIQKQQQAVNDMTETMLQNMADLMDNQTGHFQTVVKVLISELNTTIGAQQTAVETLTHKLQTELSDVIHRESDHVEDVMQRLSSQLTVDIASQQATLSQFSQDITSQTQSASSALGEVLKQIETQQTTGARALQEVMDSTRSMLDSLQASVENISGAMGNMEGAMKDMQSLSKNLGTAAGSLTETSQTLSTMTQSFLTQSDELSNRNQELLVRILDTMKEATTMTQTYVDQFSTIKSGLVKIFADIDQGLKNYRDESRETLNFYLGDFSGHLSDAARTLASSVSSMQKLVSEMEEVHQNLPGSVQSVEQLTLRLVQASSDLPDSFKRFDDVRAGLERLLLKLPAEAPEVNHETA